MSSENFEKLRQIVLSDSSLQKELRQITDREAFICRIVEMGARHTLEFGGEDVTRAMRESRRVWIERWI